jgi:hypothetical protein
MMNLYAITKADGSVSLMQTNFKPEDEIRKWSQADQDAVVSISQVDPATVPLDRTFRNAWTMANGKLECAMSKARAIHRERLRLIRGPLLLALDAAWMRATAAGDEIGALNVEAKRQALRDATSYPAIDAAASPEDLKAAIPACLL